VRFILAVVDGELSIGRKKKSVLVAELTEMGFDRMSKTMKVAAAAAEEAAAEEGTINEGSEAQDKYETAGAYTRPLLRST
jgi:hypothetical protein